MRFFQSVSMTQEAQDARDAALREELQRRERVYQGIEKEDEEVINPQSGGEESGFGGRGGGRREVLSPLSLIRL